MGCLVMIWVVVCLAESKVGFTSGLADKKPSFEQGGLIHIRKTAVVFLIGGQRVLP